MRNDFSAYLRGKAYQVKPVNESIAAGSTLYAGLNTGDCQLLLDQRTLVTGCEDFTLDAYEDQTFTGGRPIAAFNRNRRLKDVSPSFDIFGDVVTTPTGVPFSIFEISPTTGNAVIKVLGPTSDLWLLDKNTTYTIALTNNSVQEFNFLFTLTLRCVQQSEID